MLKFRKKLAEKKEASKGIAKAGFTLIELLVVIAILAILVLLAAPRFLGYTRDADKSAMQADAKVLANAALIYNIENEDNWPVRQGTDGPEAAGDRTIGEVTLQTQTLDEGAFEDHIQTLKGELSDYELVAETVTVQIGEDTETLQVGDIVFVGNDGDGVKDRNENRHYAVNIEVPKGETITNVTP